MMDEMIPVTIAGQYYYVRDRQKNFAHYEVEVELPVGETDRALQFIQKYLVVPKLHEAFPDKGVTGFRTCEIVSHIPDQMLSGAEPALEEEEEVPEDVFSGAKVEISDEEFEDVEDIVGG